MSLGKRIEGARIALGYPNAAAFSRKVGIDKQYLWNLEKDKVEKPDPSRMVMLARALNVSIEWLITGEGVQICPADANTTYSKLHLVSAGWWRGLGIGQLKMPRFVQNNRLHE